MIREFLIFNLFNMLKNISNLGKMLSKDNQKNINGGSAPSLAGAYTCSCGFGGVTPRRPPLSISADSLIDALQEAGAQCNGQGATCSGA
jgi:hypothetical protein